MKSSSLVLLALLVLLTGRCDFFSSPEAEKQPFFTISIDSEKLAEYDLVRIEAVDAKSGDTVEVLVWKKGEPPFSEVLIPGSMGNKFSLIITAVKDGKVVKAFSTEVDQRKPQTVYSFNNVPALVDVKKPEIITIPDVPGVTGDTLIVTPAIYSTDNLTFTWYRNGIPISTDSVLVISRLDSMSDGEYYLVVKNKLNPEDSTISNIFTIALQNEAVPVRITRDLQKTYTAMIGQPLLLSLSAEGTSPRYTWFKNGEPLAGAAGPSLLISSFRDSDLGTYQVMVGNSLTPSVLSREASVVTAGSGFLITIIQPAFGSISPAGSFIASAGDDISLEFSADTGYRIETVYLDGFPAESALVSGKLQLNNLSAHHTITMKVAPIPYRLSIALSDTAAGTVSSSPSDSVYYYGDQVTVTARPAAAYRFVRWKLTDGNMTANPLTLTVKMNLAIQAVFVKKTYPFSLQVNDSAFGTINASTSQTTLEHGASVSLEAVPKAGYKFSLWEGVDQSLAQINPVNLVIDRAYTIKALFGPIDSYSLGFVCCSEQVIISDEQPYYTFKDTLTLTPKPVEGMRFLNWLVNGKTRSQNPLQIIVDTNYIIEPVFGKKPAKVFYSAQPAGAGTIPKNTAADWGDTLTLTASPFTGYLFSNWELDPDTGGSSIIDPDSLSAKLRVWNDSVHVKAVFSPVTYTLTLTPGSADGSPSGGGTVEHGVPIQITSSPNANARFSHWHILSGTASIEDTLADPATVTLTHGDAEIQAFYSPAPSLGAVAFSKDGGYFENPFKLVLSVPSTPDGTVIWYSKDSTLAPDSSAQKYSDSIPVSASVTIRARAFHSDYLPGSEVRMVYKKNTSPVLSGLSVPLQRDSGAVASAALEISGTVTDDTGLVQVTARVNAASPQVFTADTSWRFNPGLVPGQWNRIIIRAQDMFGVSVSDTFYLYLKPDLAAPGAPVFTHVTRTSMTVSWSPVEYIENYEVSRSTDGTSWGIRDTVRGSTSLADTGLTASTPYWYKVRGFYTAQGGLSISGTTAMSPASMQRTVIVFEQGYTPGTSNFGVKVMQTADSGFLIAGTAYTGLAERSQFFLKKLDAFGIEQWSQTYGGAYDDSLYDFSLADDGSGVLVGTKGYSNGTRDLLLVETLALGIGNRERTYGSGTINAARAVVANGAGGYLVAGHTNADVVSGHDVWIVGFSSNLLPQWDSVYGGAQNDFGYSIAGTGNEFAVAGRRGTEGWLLKIGPQGDSTAASAYPGGALYSVVQDSAGAFISAGATTQQGAGGSDVHLIKTGNDGWDKTAGTAMNETGYSVCRTSDNGFAIGGSSDAPLGIIRNFYLVRSSESGDTLWTRTYENIGTNDDIHSIIQTSDGGFALFGSKDMNGTPSLYLIKTDSEGFFRQE